MATKLNFLQYTYRFRINHKTLYSQTFPGPHFGSWTNWKMTNNSKFNKSFKSYNKNKGENDWLCISVLCIYVVIIYNVICGVARHSASCYFHSVRFIWIIFRQSLKSTSSGMFSLGTRGIINWYIQTHIWTWINNWTYSLLWFAFTRLCAYFTVNHSSHQVREYLVWVQEAS